MPPGANSTRENRFAFLADESPAKKPKVHKQTYSPFPELPITPTEDPKYIVISSADPTTKISELSCFKVYKAIQTVSREIIPISELRDGNLLMLLKNQRVATKFLTTTYLPSIGSIKCKYHESLNTIKGTIYAPYLSKIPDEEIIAELKDEEVTSVYKFTKKIDDKQVPSGVILLTFELYHLPSKIDISWHSVKVKQYFPNPMRCKSCQRLGHTKKWCKNNAACEYCNLPPHTPGECTRTMCANCLESHPSFSAECKIFQQEKDILKIKIQNKCSLTKAKQIYKEQNVPSVHTTSYASVLTTTQPPTTILSNAQNKKKQQ